MSVFPVSARLITALALGITIVSLIVALRQVASERQAHRSELDRRAQVLAQSLQELVEPALQKANQRGSTEGLRRIVERFGNRERLAGIVIYDKQEKPMVMTADLTRRFGSAIPPLNPVVLNGEEWKQFSEVDQTSLHVYAVPIETAGEIVGALAVFHDAQYINSLDFTMWRNAILGVLVQMALIAAVTLLIIRWSMVHPLTRMTEWLRDIRAGKPTVLSPKDAALKPLAHEVTQLAASLKEARACAEEEARLRDASDAIWTAERLRVSLQNTLQGSRLFVVSNREPYEHRLRGNQTELLVPASGLVTAMEPILRASDGIWIAHGSGDADRITVDEHDRVRVPPDQPLYTLRRIWLSREEEDGYYYGFSNEGLWPLCHIAHTRPMFRPEDWRTYVEVNQKFARALLEEMADCQQPVVLCQDYHFALLPRMIKQMRPDARVSIFWHIPWPNAETFGICPWQREILDGLLGADLVGFHTQAHCNNFLETVDRTLESRIQWERHAVNRNNHITTVRPFPISVDFKEAPRKAEEEPPSLEKAKLIRSLGLETQLLGIGVDRLDYTKGIPERFRGIERFLDLYPEFRGRFSFVQIGAPTRSNIQRYQDVVSEIEQEAERINHKFQTNHWRPLVLLKRHHSHQEIEPYYRLADVCLVTSLHDGMNLVAKEFVAARHDETGVVILSQFAGAAQELQDALIINPYDSDQVARALYEALTMEIEVTRFRMARMRKIVEEHNIYRWAAELIAAVARLRLDGPGSLPPPSQTTPEPRLDAYSTDDFTLIR
jgi:alpha,alpha-trehalose-phosphate synthase [UDP-forming]